MIISVSGIIRYPIKSCKGSYLNECEVLDKGLKHDRHWALFDESGQVITGRRHPNMLDIGTKVGQESVVVFCKDHKVLEFPIISEHTQRLDKKLFSYDVQGVKVSQEVDNWFSEYLNTSCTFLNTSKDINRPVLGKHGGQLNDIVSFADQAPLLMISEASLEHLNNKLDRPISMANFRPNIVISGCEGHDEDAWKNIKIGECKFEITQRCERCIFTTIDPLTKKKSPNKEPLKTLATYRKNENRGVDFGVRMVPRKLGMIKLGDRVFV